MRVDNAQFPDIAPLGGDFSVYGGLYRPVHLIVTDEENFALTDHGSPGVAWLQTSVTATQAVLDVTAQISNGRGKAAADVGGQRAGRGRQTVVASERSNHAGAAA